MSRGNVENRRSSTVSSKAFTRTVSQAISLAERQYVLIRNAERDGDHSGARVTANAVEQECRRCIAEVKAFLHVRQIQCKNKQNELIAAARCLLEHSRRVRI